MKYNNKLVLAAQVAVQILMIVAVYVIVISCCDRNYLMALVGATGKSCLWLINKTLWLIAMDEEDDDESR